MLRVCAVPFVSNIGLVLRRRTHAEPYGTKPTFFIEGPRARIGLMRVKLKPRGRSVLREVQEQGPNPSLLLAGVDIELFDGISVDRKKAARTIPPNGNPHFAFLH